MEFYNNAGRAIDLLDNKQGSLKSIVFGVAAGTDVGLKQTRRGNPRSHSSENLSPRRISDGKRLLRVVAEGLRYRQVIEAILRNVDILNLESKVLGPSKSSIHHGHSGRFKCLPRPESLLIVLVHDHLFSSRGISLAKIHKIRLAIERHSSKLKSELSRLMVRKGVSQVTDLIDLLKPNQSQSDSTEDPTATSFSKIRWLRVNTIKWSLADAISWFKEAGWNKVSLGTLIARPSDLMFAEDDHVAHLLALPSAVTLAKLTPYLDGRLIAQDKASCIPAQLLLGDHEDRENIQVIDATSAPGNKTTMLSAIVGRKGKVWAFERDTQRFKVLKQMVNRAGCTNVKCIHGDFLAIDSNDHRFEKVSHIMVDPSCSGSGISNRLDHLSHTGLEKRDDDRINSLSKFQTTIVSHALRFPSVNQVVYSTCSIWKEENEHVVFNILKKPEMINNGWTLKDVRNTFLINQKKPWVRTGQVIPNEDKQLSDRMIRFDPTVDQTIGFFAAVFLRTRTEPIGTKASSISSGKASLTDNQNHLSSLKVKSINNDTKHKIYTWKGIRPGKLISFSC